MSRLDEALKIVSISSVSRDESLLADHIEQTLRSNPLLEVHRIGDNVVARTTGNQSTRLLVAGHIDTVPGDAAKATISGEVLHGVGACDMKGSVSVMLELALDQSPRSNEITWVFYAREEIARSESGLLEIAAHNPDLLAADCAVLGEPTGGVVEAGCQGTLRVLVTLKGARAHTARPFTGRNAIHRLGQLVSQVASYEPRTVVIDEVAFTEQLQVVEISGGIAPNVVPDLASCVLNHRVAPDRNDTEALAAIKSFIGDLLEPGDEIAITDWAPSSPPSLDSTHLQRLIALTNESPRGKVGWTDVATLQERGVPATNFGAGDPLLAHRSDEFVTLSELDQFASVLRTWLS